MKRYIILVVLLCVSGWSWGQLSSADIRHATGNGPYPVYINFLFSGAPTSNNFRDFTRTYADENDIRKYKLWLNGFEGNIGVVINEDNFLWIKNFRIKRFSTELGYRYLFMNIRHDDQRLHLQEETISLRFGMRGNILYPITYQLQAGPVIYNFATVRKYFDNNNSSSDRVRLGSGLFERGPASNNWFSGMDLRARLMLLDPAGTGGGLGIILEGRYLLTFDRKNLDPFYEAFVQDINRPVAGDSQSGNYFSWSVGVVVPLAVRIVSF